MVDLWRDSYDSMVIGSGLGQGRFETKFLEGLLPLIGSKALINMPLAGIIVDGDFFKHIYQSENEKLVKMTRNL